MDMTAISVITGGFATADLSDKTETVNEILAARHSISPKMCYIMNLTVRRRWMSPLPGRKWFGYRNISGSKKQFRFDSYIRSYL